MPFRNSILAGTTLIREAVESPNYVTGVSGWIIRKDGTAEFADMVVRSSDGISGYVEISNGHLYLRDIEGFVLAEITPDDSSGRSAFVSYDTRDSVEYYGSLSAGDIRFGILGVTDSDNEGYLQFAEIPSGAYRLVISSGVPDGAARSIMSMISETVPGAADSLVDITTDLLFVSGRFQCGGGLIADNVRSGSATTPAPGAGGGTTTVNVSFSDMPATPRITITPVSTVDPATVTIRAYVDNVTTTGFTIRCYRSTNSTSTFSWTALSAAS